MIVIILGRAAQFLLALAMMRVATTLLSPEEMGRVSLLLTTIAFFALFLVNPVGMFINLRLYAWHENGIAKHFLLRYVGYLFMVVLVAAFSLPLFYRTGVADFGVSPGWLILLVCASLLFNTINQTAIPSLNLLGYSRRFLLLSVATVTMSFACATVLIQTVDRSAQYWVLGLLVGQACLGLVGVKILFSQLKEPENRDALPTVQWRHVKTLFNFAWPVTIAAGLGWVQGQGYRYLVEGQLGLAQLGLFVAGYGISAGMIGGFESVLTTYFQPRLYRDASTNDRHKFAQSWQRYATAVIPSLLLTVGLIVVLAPELTRTFLGSRFHAAVEFVVWGALAEAARVLIGTYSLIAHAHMRTRSLILPNVIGAVLSLSLCALLIPHFGAVGVGMGLVASGAAVVATMHILFSRSVGGGAAIKPIVMAGAAGLALWSIAVSIRHLPGITYWGLIVAVCVPVGVAFLGMQYLLLRDSLTDETEA